MGGLNAVYSRDNIKPKLQMYGIKSECKNTGWFCCETTEDVMDIPNKVLCSSEVILLVFQSVTDSFYFNHLIDGTCVRELMYGCNEERLWEQDRGKEEEWEEMVFDVCIEIGAYEPMIDSREVSRVIAEFYDLPGWK